MLYIVYKLNNKFNKRSLIFNYKKLAFINEYKNKKKIIAVCDHFNCRI